VEVDKQADGNIQKLHITEQLSFAYRIERFNGFGFYQQTFVDEEIETQRFVENEAFVFNPNDSLCHR
jgi:hypothetical protein